MGNYKVSPLQQLGDRVSKWAKEQHQSRSYAPYHQPQKHSQKMTGVQMFRHVWGARDIASRSASSWCFCSMHMGGQVNKMQNDANNYSKWSWNSPIRDPGADRMLMWEWPIACKLIHPVFCACQGDSSFYNNFNKSAVIHADGEAIESWMLSRKTWFCCESTVIQSNRHDAIKCDDVSKLWIENLIRVEPT